MHRDDIRLTCTPTSGDFHMGVHRIPDEHDSTATNRVVVPTVLYHSPVIRFLQNGLTQFPVAAGTCLTAWPDVIGLISRTIVLETKTFSENRWADYYFRRHPLSRRNGFGDTLRDHTPAPSRSCCQPTRYLNHFSVHPCI